MTHHKKREALTTRCADYVKHLTLLPVMVNCSRFKAMARKRISPIGTSVEQDRRDSAARSPRYRREQERLAEFERIARLVIKYRSELSLTQKQLAELVGTSHSAISRIESGQHRTNLETLRRIAHALNHRFVIGFERGSVSRPIRDVIAV
jgi:DNA-binding XRE family transcriptional regulator